MRRGSGSGGGGSSGGGSSSSDADGDVDGEARIATAAELIAEIQAVQRLADADFAAVGAEHAAIWHLVGARGGELTDYPRDQAALWCHGMTEHFVRAGDSAAMGRECRHAFGHAVFYNVALRPFGAYGREACHQFRPYSYTLDAASLARATAICDGAQTDALRSDCKDGVSHSAMLMTEGGGFVGI